MALPHNLQLHGRLSEEFEDYGWDFEVETVGYSGKILG